MTRSEAILSGKNKYFTGNPCKSGHLAYRYVQSGSCELCIRAAQTLPDHEYLSAREKLTALRLESQKLQKELVLQRRKTALLNRQMKSVPFNLHLEDEEEFLMIVTTMARFRFPEVQNVIGKYPPRTVGANLRRHYFRVFPQDIEAFNQIALDLAWHRRTEKEKEWFCRNHQPRKDGWVPPPLRA